MTKRVTNTKVRAKSLNQIACASLSFYVHVQWLARFLVSVIALYYLKNELEKNGPQYTQRSNSSHIRLTTELTVHFIWFAHDSSAASIGTKTSSVSQINWGASLTSPAPGEGGGRHVCLTRSQDVQYLHKNYPGGKVTFGTTSAPVS